MGLCTSKPSLPDSSIHVTHPQSEPGLSSSADVPPANDSGGDMQEQGESSSSADDKKRKERKELDNVKKSPFFPFYNPSPGNYFFSKKPPARSPAPSGNFTPKRFFNWPFPPPSSTKHIRAVLERRHGSVKPNEASILEGSEVEGMAALDKSFGFLKHFGCRRNRLEKMKRIAKNSNWVEYGLNRLES